MKFNPVKRRVTAERIKELLEYRDGKLYWKVNKGSTARIGDESGWTDIHGYRLTRIDGELLRNHHIVWCIFNGHWPEQELDHIDNDPSNNRIDNLRVCGRLQQGANQRLQKRRGGSYKGVHVSSSGKYYVKLKFKGKTIPGLGSRFTCQKEAALAYNYKALELFGVFGNFNKVFEDQTDE